MSPENRSSIISDPQRAWNARKADLRMHFDAYIAGLNEVEQQFGTRARGAHRIYTARLTEIEQQQISLFSSQGQEGKPEDHVKTDQDKLIGPKILDDMEFMEFSPLNSNSAKEDDFNQIVAVLVTKSGDSLAIVYLNTLGDKIDPSLYEDIDRHLKRQILAAPALISRSPNLVQLGPKITGETLAVYAEGKNAQGEIARGIFHRRGLTVDEAIFTLQHIIKQQIKREGNPEIL